MKNFGQFRERRLSLQPGLNVICGGNEAGKTTAAEFVHRMFFGMKRGRGRAAGRDAYARYLPWRGGEPEGSLLFSCRERSFRLKRSFPDRAELFCMDDGEVLDVEQGDLRMLLGGLEEGLYESTVCASGGQTGLSGDFAEALGSYLLNMETVREEESDVPGAERYLRECRRRAEQELRRLAAARQREAELLGQRQAYLAEQEEALRRKLQKAGEALGAYEAAEEREAGGGFAGGAGERRGTEGAAAGDGRKRGERRFWPWGLSAAFGGGLLLLAAEMLAENGVLRAAAVLLLALGAGLLLTESLHGRNRTAEAPDGRRRRGESAEGERSRRKEGAAEEAPIRREEPKAEGAGNREGESARAGAAEERLWLRLRIEHLQEEIEERVREQENCREEQEELSKVSAQERRLQLETEACQDAEERIRRAAGELTGDWGGRLEGRASHVLERLTEGRYRGLRLAGPQGLTVLYTGGSGRRQEPGRAGEQTARAAEERICTPEQLSTGTRDQIFTAVRLAAAELLTEEPVPFVFDDAFLSWDDARLERLLRYLADSGRQTLLFCGGEREERLLERNHLPYAKIMLDEPGQPVYKGYN